jgi:hypothetical protein
MPELVIIPSSSAEYEARFERPYIGFISYDRARAYEAVLTALLSFNLRLENTEIVTTGTPANHKTIFRIPERGISFQFGAETYKFNKDFSFWAAANEDGQILLAAERALMEGSGAKVASCRVVVAMHLQPLSKPREEILAPFIPEPFKIFMTQRQTQSYGNHFLFADGDVLLDFSVGFANGIFLRFSSRFMGHPPLSEILAKVRSDQAALFGLLGVEEAVNA